jgi:hypothetical protein
MKKLALIMLLAMTAVAAHAKGGSHSLGGMHFRAPQSLIKNFQGPTEKKYSAVKSDYYNVHLHMLEQPREGGSTMYRGLSPQARHDENQLLRQNYLKNIPNSKFWS